ncbi:CD209 antigen-like protein C isoform X3 [Siniperca chuatsi]|nr:CD209 antigen-like protein C isoform X3 [Siniperca chuatsi]
MDNAIERDKLQRSYSEMESLNHHLTQITSQLENEKDLMKAINNNLTIERDKLQRSYSEMESLNHHLTQITSQLENEKDLMKAINNNLTKERDELQTQLETTCCPDHWIKFGNSCYLISNSKKNWNDSRTFCKNEDAQLVIISSYEEQELLSSFKREAWIGLTDAQTETVWKWVNGTEVTKTYWRNGQPDNYQNSENCAEISDRYPDLSNWNDLSCSSSVHFICEKILQ